MKSPSITIPKLLSQSECRNENVLHVIEERVTGCIETIEQYYNIKIKQIISPVMSKDYNYICDSEAYVGPKWIKKPDGTKKRIPGGKVKINNYDFTGYIALTQYNDYYPFDPTVEVWGGELIFTNYGAKIIPTAGNLIVFPTCSNFSHQHLESNIGELIYAKLFFICEEPFVYDCRIFKTKPFTTNIDVRTKYNTDVNSTILKNYETN